MCGRVSDKHEMVVNRVVQGAEGNGTAKLSHNSGVFKKRLLEQCEVIVLEVMGAVLSNAQPDACRSTACVGWDDPGEEPRGDCLAYVDMDVAGVKGCICKFCTDAFDGFSWFGEVEESADVRIRPVSTDEKC